MFYILSDMTAKLHSEIFLNWHQINRYNVRKNNDREITNKVAVHFRICVLEFVMCFLIQ